MYRKLLAFFREVIFLSLIGMILRRESRNQFYFWNINSNMTEVVVQKRWISHFCYAVFGLFRVNNEIIEAPMWIPEPAGNFILITI